MATFFIPSKEPKKERIPFDPSVLINQLKEWVDAQELWSILPLCETSERVLLIREVPVVVANWINKAPQGREYPTDHFQEVVLVVPAGLDNEVDKEEISRKYAWTKRVIITDNMESIKKHLTILEEKNP